MRYKRYIVGALVCCCVSCVGQRSSCANCDAGARRNPCYPISYNVAEERGLEKMAVPVTDISAVYALTPEQQRQLARCIVESAVWKRQFTKYHRHEAEQLRLELTESDSVFSRVILPHLRKALADQPWAAALLSEDGLELREMSSSFFSFVAENYVKQHPQDANGWYFLWLFMAQPNDSFETPYCEVICDWLAQEHMERTPYGRQIMSRVREERSLHIPYNFEDAVLQPGDTGQRMKKRYCNLAASESPFRQVTHSPRRNAQYLSARKRWDALPEPQKTELAAAIATAADWTSLCAAPPYGAGIIDSPESIFHLHALPALQRRIAAHSAARSLLRAKKGQVTPLEALGTDLFLIVGDYYLKQHPDDRNAWNFLLLHAKESTHGEYNAETIGHWILNNNMLEHTYARRLMNLLRESCCVEVADTDKPLD